VSTLRKVRSTILCFSRIETLDFMVFRLDVTVVRR